MDLRNMRILITGGGTGIGEALAKTFARAGAEVAICGRRIEPLEKVQSKIPSIRAYKADVVVHDQILALKQQLDRDMEGIDVLINNAGRMVQFDMKDGLPDSAGSEVELNLMAPVELVDIFLPQLLRRERSAIINVTSGYALSPSKSAPLYCATKAALHSFTKSLRWQLENTPVRVIEILPPVVSTSAAVVKGGMDPMAFSKRVIRQIRRGRTEIKVGQVMFLAVMRHLAPGIIDSVLKKR
jgi:short-subunit dehydrogenase involved in D-alanine esterification of teichoic acids